MITCDQPGCGAPAEIQREYTLQGVGFSEFTLRPTDIILGMAKVLCEAGHLLDVELDSVELDIL